MARVNQPGFSIQDITRFLPIISAIGIFAGLVTFLGRLYLESYYAYFGIPPSVLEFDVQDYTFGSFPLILLVLMVTVSVTIYWLLEKPGLLGSILRRFADDLIFDFVKWLNVELRSRLNKSVLRRRRHAATATGRFRYLTQTRHYIGSLVESSGSTAFLTFMWIAVILLLFLVGVLFAMVVFVVILTIVFIGFSILGLGASLNLLESLPKISQVNWDLWNIPGLRGLVSGFVLAAGTLLLISIIEALWVGAGKSNNAVAATAPPEKPESSSEDGGEGASTPDNSSGTDGSDKNADSRRWVSPIVLLMVVIMAMPIVTHFMARDQAIADLNSDTSRFFSSLPVAVFTSKLPLADGDMWATEIVNQVEDGPVYQSPALKVVLVNGTAAYVLLKNDERTENQLFTIRLTDIEHIRYSSQIKESTNSR